MTMPSTGTTSFFRMNSLPKSCGRVAFRARRMKPIYGVISFATQPLSFTRIRFDG